MGNTLTIACGQLEIKMLTKQGTFIDIHEFRSTPEKIEKRLQNRWGYDTQEKKYRLLPEFLDILYILQNTFS